MRGRVLWRLSVTLERPVAEEAVAELLAGRYGQPASSYTDFETGKTVVSVYLKTRPEWSGFARDNLNIALKEISNSRQFPLVRLTKLRAEDWAEAWKHHFKPLEIGNRLLVKPSWSRRLARPAQVEIVLDPGMSFGTGQHPTTAFCLAELVRVCRSDNHQSFLDVGTGSGILAICAAKLGYRPVHALDIDEQAVRIARANARANGITKHIRFECRNLSSFESAGAKQYSVVCANLLANLLLVERARLVSLIAPRGIIVVAGILKEEFQQIKSAYEGAGLRLTRSRAQNEWRSGSFRRQFWD